MDSSEVETGGLKKNTQRYTMAPQRTTSSQVPWDADSTREDCTDCKTPFSFFRRRHHCRACGHLFCDACSDNRSPVLKWRIIHPVRVCSSCHSLIKRLSSAPPRS